MGVVNSKKEKHINFLKKIGFLLNYNDLDLYHGRSQTADEEWHIRTDVDNSSSVEKDNIMGIPCLCVASYDVAENYARGTSLGGRNGVMSVYKIVSTDEDSLIAIEKFNVNKLSPNDTIKFFQAIQALTQGSLNGFFKKLNISDMIILEIKRLCGNSKLISQTDEEIIFNNLLNEGFEIDTKLINKIVGAINSKILFNKLPVITVSDFVFLEKGKRDYVTSGGEKYSVNHELIKYIMDVNNIIGLKKKVFAGINDDIVYVFNLSKIISSELIQPNQI